jgi:hypothetical protein
MKLLVFDDIQQNREQVLSALRQTLGANGNIDAFVPGDLNEGTHEVRLAKDLQELSNANSNLIIADRDLSSYTDAYRGLSESTVRRVADSLGIPECGYARGERADDQEYIEEGERREACIRLSLKPDLQQFAKKAVAIAEGFTFISEKLATILQETGKKSPGKLLASVLNKREYADKISLFASGDQNRLSLLADVRKSKDQNERQRRLACFLGYWLWDSVLRFPGVVVNEIAASSYLNIQLEEFRQDENIRALFRDSRYSGPFAEAKPALWWRGMLDDLIATSGFSDGREYVTKKLGRSVRQSECCEDSSKSAGYYCFLSERPVSLQNSKPGLTWFPRGADLTRVCKSRYDEEEPWL